MVETHDRTTQVQYDSARYADLTVIHDTIAILRTETLWRQPDSTGNIYPLMTISTETSASRQTHSNITSTRIDTMYIVNHRDGSSIDKINQRTVPAIDSRASPAVAWGILIMCIIFLILTIAAVIAVKLLRRFFLTTTKPTTYKLFKNKQ